ncbi:MAG: YciI family protein [Paracoccaceae bacterium]
MLVAIIARDRPGSLELRKARREAHLAYLESSGEMVRLAGPLMDEAGAMCGSLLVLEVEDMQAARDWAAEDPYAKAALFQSVEIHAWKKVIG